MHAAVGLLPSYTGTAVHDGYASYFTHAGCTHALLAAGETAEPPPVRGAPRWKPRRSPDGQLLHRLRRDRDAVLRFPADLRVPFDNSEAERDLRMMKVEQNVSGGFRTPADATFCTLRGYLSTARKQRPYALGALRDLPAGQPFTPAVPYDPNGRRGRDDRRRRGGVRRGGGGGAGGLGRAPRAACHPVCGMTYPLTASRAQRSCRWLGSPAVGSRRQMRA